MEKQKKLFVINGEKVKLVPYLKAMVPTYNKWMQDPFLLEMTGSEPLTLEEEYENQISWLKDNKKITFIVLEKLPDSEFLGKGLPEICRGGQMCGDVNLYMHEFLEPEEAEIEVMIAEESSRKKGLATEALKLMANFAVTEYQKQKLIAKIKSQNQPSIKLFEKLGFVKFKEIKAFEEVHYELEIKRDADGLITPYAMKYDMNGVKDLA